MSVYLIHFDQKLKHAGHYIGFANQVDKRLAHHKNGTGARILKVCNDLGITYGIVKVWEGKDRLFERKLKNSKNAPRLCPVCNPQEVKK